MNCPHCNKKLSGWAIEKAVRNVESYGGESFNLQCPKCKEKYCITLERDVKVLSIQKVTDKTTLLDFYD